MADHASHNAAEMACEEFVEAVTDYLEGALSDRDRLRLEEHLAQCDPCTTYLEQLRSTLREVGRISPEALSGTASQQLRAAFRDWARGAQTE